MRPVTVSVGPLANASATNIGASQTAPGVQALVLNGSLADETANNIAQSQSPGAAGNLTLNGSLVTGGVAYIGPSYQATGYPMRRVYITSAGDDSGVTFTVTGTGAGPTGFYGVSETVTGADTSTVSTTKTFYTVTSIAISGASAAAVTVGVNGIATLDKARHIILTSGGNDTDVTFTLTGTDAAGNPQTENLVGASGAAAESILDYKTLTGITTSAGVETTVTIGTNGEAASAWVRFDEYAGMAPAIVQCVVSGTVNYTVQQTLQDPNSNSNPVAAASVTWSDWDDTDVVGATATKVGTQTVVPIWARVYLNSGTGSVTATFSQPYTK